MKGGRRPGPATTCSKRRPPFSPEAVVEEFGGILRQYGCTEVTGDKYAGEWPRERFQKAGIVYRVAERTKSELYGDFLPLVTSARVELLDDERLLRQLGRLERRTARSGRLSERRGGRARSGQASRRAQPRRASLRSERGGAASSDRCAHRQP